MPSKRTRSAWDRHVDGVVDGHDRAADAAGDRLAAMRGSERLSALPKRS
jgi:hypothetical protein